MDILAEADCSLRKAAVSCRSGCAWLAMVSSHTQMSRESLLEMLLLRMRLEAESRAAKAVTACFANVGMFMKDW